MPTVSVTEFRQHLPTWLKRGQAGEEIHITSRGRVIARLLPEEDPAEAASKRLKTLQGTVIIGDILVPLDEEWTGDEDNL